MDFSHRLLTARKAKGISQESLAESLGISRQAVSKWETGESKPDLDNLTALCAQLDVTMEYLCFGKTAPEAPVPEPPATPSKSRLWTVGVAVLSLLLGFFLGFLVFHNAGNTMPVRDYARELEAVSVANATVQYNELNACYEISVLPSSVPEGMEAELLMEHLNNSFFAPKTLPCHWDGVYYTAETKNLSMTSSYRVTVVFRLSDTQKNCLVMNFYPDPDFNIFSFDHLWKEQN